VVVVPSSAVITEEFVNNERRLHGRGLLAAGENPWAAAGSARPRLAHTSTASTHRVIVD